MGNKSSILSILYALFPLKYGRFIDVFGGSGSVLLGNPCPCAFEVYNDFDRNLANLFRCMKERTMATIRELGFVTLIPVRISSPYANSLKTSSLMTDISQRN